MRATYILFASTLFTASTAKAYTARADVPDKKRSKYTEMLWNDIPASRGTAKSESMPAVQTPAALFLFHILQSLLYKNNCQEPEY